ncbi:MAG: PIN domain-containing protein [Verrucomicrobiales bacterium]
MPSADLPPPMNHVFEDFENVHEIDLSIIGMKSVSFTLLLGALQKRLDAELVEKLMEHATSVQLVRLTSSGRNALDFALAYYLGRAVTSDPTGYFHIVSKDVGFDPLIDHLKTRRLRVRRHDDFSTLSFSASAPPPPKSSAPSATNDSLTRALTHLRRNTKNRPKRNRTLETHLLAHFGKSATTEEITALIARLQQAGFIRIDEKGAVTYQL